MLTDLLAHINATRHLDVRPEDLTEPFGVKTPPARTGDYVVAPQPDSPIWHTARFDGRSWHAIGFEVGRDWVWRGLREPARSAPEEPLPQWAARTLAEMRAKTLAALDGMRREALVERESGDQGGDEIDVACAQIARETRLRAAQSLQARLREIDDAIDRLRRGVYGICEAAGEEISRRRLKANPLARHTVEYQERLDRSGRFVTR